MAFVTAVGVGAPTRSTLAPTRRHALTRSRPVGGRAARVAAAAAVRMDAGTEASGSPGTPKPVGIGIIGCGRIGQVHAKAISSTLGAKLVAVADPFEKFGRSVAAEFSTTWVADWKELVANPDVDGVVIGSPTPFHAEQIIACAEAGKAIFCEKPISNDLATIDSCLEVVERTGVKLLVGFQRRFDSNFQKVKSVVSSGAIGDVRTFTITSRDPSPPPADYLAKSGGIFLDMASHDFDMARFVCGAEIESVYVTGAAIESAAQEAGDLDTVVTVLKMSNGAFGTIENSRRCGFGYDQRIEVFGGKGSVTGSNKSADTVTVSTEAGIGAGLPYDFFMDRYAAAYTGIMGAFVTMVAQDGAVPVGGADGRAPIVAAKAAQLSVQEGRLVRLDEVDLVKAAAGVA